MLYSRSNLLTGYFQPNNQSNSIQRQRSFIQRSNVLHTELHRSSINNSQQHKIKRDIERQSPVILRRHRPTIENHTSYQQSSDVNDVFGNQLQLTLPPHSTSRHTRSPRSSSLHTKLLNYSKTFNEGTIKQLPLNTKSSHSLQPSIWTPRLTEKEVPHNRTRRSRSLSSKHFISPRHQLQTDKNHLSLKQPFVPDLYISSRSLNNDAEIFKKTNNKTIIDEWEDPKSNVAVLSDEEESIVTNCNAPILTYNPQIHIQEYDHFVSSSLITNEQLWSSNDNFKLKPPKPINLRRPSYGIVLPPVAEHVNDDEINDEIY